MDFFKAGCWIDSKAAALQQTKQKLIRDLSKRKTIGFAHPEQIGWI